MCIKMWRKCDCKQEKYSFSWMYNVYFWATKSKTKVTMKLYILHQRETLPVTKSFETTWILVECKSWRIFLQVIFDCFVALTWWHKLNSPKTASKKNLLHGKTYWFNPLRPTSKPFWGEQSWFNTWNVASWLKHLKCQNLKRLKKKKVNTWTSWWWWDSTNYLTTRKPAMHIYNALNNGEHSWEWKQFLITPTN